MPKPLITIAVPSFNQGRFLNATLTSIFAQDLPVEVFVMDGGSSDNSLDIIHQWEPQLAGWRSHADSGQAAAINEGILSGTAPYVCWLNSDDFFYPDGLLKLLQCLQNSRQHQFAYGRCWTVSESGSRLSPYLTLPFFPRLLANFCFIAQPATLVTRTAWESVEGLNENMQMALDYDLWWRLYIAHGKPIYCREFVAATRMHTETKTANHADLHYRESIDVVNRYWGSIPFKWRIALPLVKMTRQLLKSQPKSRK